MLLVPALTHACLFFCCLLCVQEEYDLAAYDSSEEELVGSARRPSRKNGGRGVDWGAVGRRARAALRSQLEQMSAARARAGAGAAPREVF